MLEDDAARRSAVRALESPAHRELSMDMLLQARIDEKIEAGVTANLVRGCACVLLQLWLFY